MRPLAERRTCWLALNLVLADSLRPAQRLLAHFGSPENVLGATARELEALGLDRDRAVRLAAPGLLAEAARVAAAAGRKGWRILTRDDDAYPGLLREIFDPPHLLFVAGDPAVLSCPAVAVVGARRPTPFGRAVAERLARDLAARGLVVASGLAVGIDSLAHWGALQAGRTVAVLGSGFDDIYPRENTGLFRKIAETGAVVTEFPPSAAPLAFRFPLRNRIISGLTLAVVVVEATMRSGSLITARLALEQNREVMAVPGNITSALSSGANWLIKTGAKLVETWRDVVEELPASLRETLPSTNNQGGVVRPEPSFEEKKILDVLKTDALTPIDELVEMTDVSVSEALARLLSLELKGLVRQAPGKCFQRSL